MYPRRLQLGFDPADLAARLGLPPGTEVIGAEFDPRTQQARLTVAGPGLPGYEAPPGAPVAVLAVAAGTPVLPAAAPAAWRTTATPPSVADVELLRRILGPGAPDVETAVVRRTGPGPLSAEVAAALGRIRDARRDDTVEGGREAAYD